MYTITKKVKTYGSTLLFLAFLSTTGIAQKTYYVASAGKDTNNGLSSTTPFRSLTSINSLTLQPGDTVLFRRGDTFRGTLRLRQSGTAGSPIVIDAYGSGRKPVLAASVPLGSWVRQNGSVWRSSCPECGNRLTGLYRNGIVQPLGRYPNPGTPNRGYLTVQAHIGTSELTSAQPLLSDWTGAEVVLFPTYWIIDRATITGQRGNTLTLNNPSSYTLTDSWGFLIQNHPATLDQTGEWYYNPADQSVLLFDDQENPNRQAITVTAADRCIDLANVSFITLKNLHFTQATTELLTAANVSNLTLLNNDFTNSGEDGLVFTGTGNTLLLENNTIQDINNNGLYIGSYQQVTIRKNTLKRIAVAPNRGKRGDGQFTALQSFATWNTLVENNLIDSVGYIGLSVFSNSTIRQNLVSNFCMAKSDGGGIYLWNGNQLPLHNILVESNIIWKGVGTTGSLQETVRSGANGIFLDDCVTNVTLQDNTIGQCNGIGINLNAVNTLRLLRNTCFDNSISQLILFNYDYDQLCLPRNNTIAENILIAKTPAESVVGYISKNNDLSDFGSMTKNYYARPFQDEFTIRAVYNTSVVADLSLPQWQAQFRQDLTTKTSPLTYRDYRIDELGKHNLLNSTFTNTSEDWSTWSPYNNGSASWATIPQLDGGSLKLAFSKPSGQPDSYLLAYKPIQSVGKSKSYLLRFDVIAPVLKKISVFIRQQNSPYQDLTRRYDVLAGPVKRSVEVALTALADEPNAFLTVQFQEDNQSVWLDNIWLQEVTSEAVNPDDYLHFFYNPTTKDSLITLDGSYRDVKNHYYTRNIILKPFASMVLLRDSLPPVDVSLSLKADRTALKVGDVVSFSLALHNDSVVQTTVSNQVQWACRLPHNLTLLTSPGLIAVDSMVRGTVRQLRGDTTIVFRMKATSAGQAVVMAQVTATTYADPDSTPDSDDGEDDEAAVSLFVRELTAADTLITATEPTNPSSGSNPVYPNPTNGEFSFRAEAPIQTLTLSDLLGRVYTHYDLIRQDERIQFGDRLAPGYYLLTVRYATGEQRTIKLLKLGR